MDSALFKARVADTARQCERTSHPAFLGFLSAGERAAAEKDAAHFRARTVFFGGYENAERVIMGCFPDWQTEDDFPISALTFTYRKEKALLHKDFLGALMALGIKRETVGDILTEPGRTVVFLSADIAPYVKTQITKIGSEGVRVSDGFAEPLPAGDTLKSFSATAASDRLDCVVACLCGVSRSTAAELIESGLVSLNSSAALKLTARIGKGDVLSVRTKGRFVISSADERTKKNRLVIEYKKYI